MIGLNVKAMLSWGSLWVDVIDAPNVVHATKIWLTSNVVELAGERSATNGATTSSYFEN